MQPHPQPLLPTIKRACPAKLNLRLAITGRRKDSYHNLSSVVTLINLYDDLYAAWDPAPAPDTLVMPGSHIEVGASNLVIRAIKAFRAVYDFPGHLNVTLHKNIPAGAGLGGGSSDAAGMLMGLQAMWGQPIEPLELRTIAARLGADVPLFLEGTTALMRGIGDELSPLPLLHEQLKALEFLVFKPSFGISTAWAYQELAKAAAYQKPSVEAVTIAAVQSGTVRVEDLLFNAFRPIVDHRYPTLPVLLHQLQKTFSVPTEMSGSGSACFLIHEKDAKLALIKDCIRQAWGENVFCKSAQIV